MTTTARDEIARCPEIVEAAVTAWIDADPLLLIEDRLVVALTAAIAALPSAPDSVRLELAAKLCPWRPQWRHKKRGSEYMMAGAAELQAASPIQEGALLVIYEGRDGKWWARPTEEFHDGRFESLPPPPSEET